jgi:pimeloyl-ACP methyl ester carboxylesterase|tara:strand:+ start:15318 stop:16010 length:693 start_codon:yes stop_codon:yes gene_type:complete
MNMLPSILFVHGLATSGARTWGENGWLDLVQDANRESIVTDLPGHGANYNTASDMTYEKCYESVLSSISTPPLDAIGFSLGARILLTIASRKPDTFRKLVLSGIGDNLFSIDKTRYKNIRDGIEGNPNPSNPESRYFNQLSEADDINRLAIQELINSPQLPLAVDQLREVNCPVLVVIGENDFAAPATELLDSLPNATYLELKGVDHFATPKNFTFMETALKFIDAEPQW